MTMYPDAQIRGQEELDRVIGTDRLPDFKDRPRLPFMEALFLETMRWHPVGPLGQIKYPLLSTSCSQVHLQVFLTQRHRTTSMKGI